jgi:hypothetical protein
MAELAAEEAGNVYATDQSESFVDLSSCLL